MQATSGLGGGSQIGIYNDPHIVQLSDLLNAQAKMSHGALAHIITARILDSHPSREELQNLLDNAQYREQLFAHIADEVLPTSANAKARIVTDDAESPNPSPIKTLSRNNSWSDLLMYDRA